MSTKHLILSITIILASMPLYAQNKDWAGFGKYSDANSNVTVKPKAVLFGDSITEGWVRQDPDFFAENNLIGRGISGQTTSQILVRMRQDVVNLHPKYVVILCGINDIALNDGHAVDVEAAVGSIKSMCEIARANKIKPILCSLLPSYNIRWRPTVTDCYDKVLQFNDLLKAYAKEQHLRYVDYFTLLAGKDGKILPAYSKDTVHPNLEGYKLMEDYLLGFLKLIFGFRRFVHLFNIVNIQNQEVKGCSLSIRDRGDECGFRVYLQSLSKDRLVVDMRISI